jgi:putative membrane protein insertion efficiency factor
MKKLLLLLLNFYSKHISPHFPRRCKYYPTCSAYAAAAITRFGALRGVCLAVWRLLRCNPYSMGGIDPVPEKFHLYFVKNMGLAHTSDNFNISLRDITRLKKFEHAQRSEHKLGNN